ncbi:hypothetical protein AC579_1910 [Pseudocercospora musae]|uniref:PD-(D/E)XK nuclease-like domain-containing protein n=1 Tax=Pseudocercospora musae TaxID=113226 RepID=A0A139HFF3_9PEZI|nr:hypothetical protein AC579_1910 [Pseudocercospora musae]
MWNVSVWVDEVAALADNDNREPHEPHESHRPHERLSPSHPCSKRKRMCKRPGLVELSSNTMSRACSPSKKRKVDMEGDMEVDELEQELLPEDETETPRPNARQRISHRGAQASAHPFAASERFAPPPLSPSPWPPQAASGRMSTPSRGSARTSTASSRSRSPVKDVTDLQFADIAVVPCLRDEVEIPSCATRCLETLAGIVADEEWLPESVAQDMEAHGERLNSFVRKNASEDPAPSDWEEWKEICQIAREQERDAAAEPAWNSEVHSAVFKCAFRFRRQRIRHFNITRAHPVKAFLPIVDSRTSEARLVDYSINYLPTEQERDDITRLLHAQADSELRTVTQTLTKSVRFRPCLISVETKADAGTLKAKSQLGVWGAAHFQRLQTLFTRRGETDVTSDVLSVHPAILVQSHTWNLFLLVARGWGTSGTSPQRQRGSIDIIDLDICLGGTKNLRQIWKLRASLHELARWGEEEYWPAFHELMEQELAGSHETLVA